MKSLFILLLCYWSLLEEQLVLLPFINSFTPSTTIPSSYFCSNNRINRRRRRRQQQQQHVVDDDDDVVQSIMKVSIYIAITIDGYVADDNGNIDFLNEYNNNDSDNDTGFQDFLNTVDVIVMGRKTFEKVLSFETEVWPYGKIPLILWTRDNNYNNIPNHLKDFVQSSCLPIEQLYNELKIKQQYQHVYVDGGYTIQQFLYSEFIDIVQLFHIPLLLGSGISLFGNNNGTKQSQQLKLIHIHSYPNGICKTEYHVIKNDICKTIS